MNILTSEANYTDEAVINETGKEYTFENSCCLTMSINMYFAAQLDFLNKGMELELILGCEWAEHFMYTSSIYELIVIRRTT